MAEIYVNTPEFLAANKLEVLRPYITDENIALNLVYDSDFKSAKILRDIVEGVCELMKIDAKWKSRITLIVDEMNNNAIEYGTKKWEKNTMKFSITRTVTEVSINIEVEDKGNGESPKKALEMESLKEEKIKQGFMHHHSIRWRGLFMIILTLVDTLYFKDSDNGGLIVGITKKLSS